MVAALAPHSRDSRSAPALRSTLSTVKEDTQADLSRQNSAASVGNAPDAPAQLNLKKGDPPAELSRQSCAAPAGDATDAFGKTLTLSTADFEDDDGNVAAPQRGKLWVVAEQKWEDKGEATLLKRTHQVKRLRQFMPSIIEETEEDICKQEEEDDDDEAAARGVTVVEEHDTVFDVEFLKYIIESNVVAKDLSLADPDFIQDFGDILRILRKKAKQEDAFAKTIAGQLTTMRIREKAVLLKYIRHILLNDITSIQDFFDTGGFASVLNVALLNDEMLDQLPGIILATRGQQAVLRQLVDEGIVLLLVKRSKRSEEAVVAAAAIALACLVEVQEGDRQALDAWFECLLDLGFSEITLAQTYACATLCKTTARPKRQIKALQKAGTGPFFKLFHAQKTPESILWISGALANLAANSANFQEFVKFEALNVLHYMSNSIWDEVRLEAAWILVFLSLQKALHQQAVGHWSAWVREALTIALCSNDTLTTSATRFFFAKITEKTVFPSYQAPLVRNYLQNLHLSDDLVREHAQALLWSTARRCSSSMVECLLALCCAQDIDQSIALTALSSLCADSEIHGDVAKYPALWPFVCRARGTDANTQLLCARILTSFVSTPQSLQEHQDSEPVSALLFLCDSTHEEVRTAALKGLWVALEVGLRNPEMCAVPILQCCKEDETAETLRACLGRVITEVQERFTRQWGRRVSEGKLFAVYTLCSLAHDASAAVQGRLAYEIDKFSEEQERLSSLDDFGVRMLVNALMSLAKSVVDFVKSSVVTVFTRLLSCIRQLPDRREARHSCSIKGSAEHTNVTCSFEEPLDHFLAESYTQCICDILLNPTAGAEVRQHCLFTLCESLDDRGVCQCLGAADFMSRLFALEIEERGSNPLGFYMVFCRILSQPAMVGNLPMYLNTLQRLLRDAKDSPSLVPPLAQLLNASSFLPPVQGVIYSSVQDVCELLIGCAQADPPREAVVLDFLRSLARLAHVPGSKFQEFGTGTGSLSRSLLLELFGLLKRYSGGQPPRDAAQTKHLRGNGKGEGNPGPVFAELSETAQFIEKKHGSNGTTIEMRTAELLRSTVEALLALYRLGLMANGLSLEIVEIHLLPVFQNMRHWDSSMVPLLSFANSLCADPLLLDCLLSTSIVSDIANSLAEDSLQDRELCVQVAEFLRVAVLHEEAQEKIIEDIALVDCIFRLIRSPNPAAQARALFALHSIVAHPSILRTMAAENFVQVLCNIALHGETADVQRVAAGVISTLVSRPSCRDVLFAATSFVDIMHLVQPDGPPEVFLQIVWALSYLPLTDTAAKALMERRAPERFKELLSDKPSGVQIQALKTIAQLSTSEKFRRRFVKLDFLPLLLNVVASDNFACCAETMKVLRLLTDSAAESAVLLDLGVERTIHVVLVECLRQNQNAARYTRDRGQTTLLPEELRAAGTPCNVAASAFDRPVDLEDARQASLALLCQLCMRAVRDQLALFNDETVKTVVACVASRLPQDVEERRSISTIFRIWANVSTLRKLMIQEGGLGVIMRLVIQTDDAVEMDELASCIGKFASNRSAAVETRLAESGAVDALEMYTSSRYSNVRESAQKALSNFSQETMEYAQLLRTREPQYLGLSVTDQHHRALLKEKWKKSGITWLDTATASGAEDA